MIAVLVRVYYMTVRQSIGRQAYKIAGVSISKYRQA